MLRKVTTICALFAALSLGACTNPYSGGQRAVGGGLLGAGAGGIGCAVIGCDPATGALIGAAGGAGAGYLTTPQRPNYGYGSGAGYGGHRRGW